MDDQAFLDHVAGRRGQLPGVEAVTLGGSRAEGTHRPDSDWDFSVYYRRRFDPQALRDIGWPGEVTSQAAHAVLAARGEWITNEKALLTRAGLRRVDELIAAVKQPDPGALRDLVDRSHSAYRDAVGEARRSPPGPVVMAACSQGRAIRLTQ